MRSLGGLFRNRRKRRRHSIRKRQLNRYRGTSTRPIRCLDRSAVALNDSATNSQAEPDASHAVRIAAEEFFEDSILVSFGNSRAQIAYENEETCLIRNRTNLNRRSVRSIVGRVLQ